MTQPGFLRNLVGPASGSDVPQVRPLAILAILLGAAASLGLAEAALLGIRYLLSGELVWAGPRLVWMAPAGYLVLAGLPALLLAGAARLRPGLGRLALAAGMAGLSAIGTMTLLRLATEQRLHLLAMLIAGLGLGYQVARVAYRNPWAAVRRGLGFTAVSLGVIAIAAVWVELRAVLREASGRRITEAAAVSPEAPNILLLILDTVRAQQLGLYGFDRPTSPVLDSVGAGAVVFENAFVTSSWTLPSHASMFTGRFPHEVEANWRRPLEAGLPTVAEALRGAGYHTGGFVGNLYYTTRESGLARGFSRYEDYPVNAKELLLSTEFAQLLSRSHARIILREHAAKRSERLVRDFLRWQKDLDPGRPFFAFLNLFDAHTPRYAPDSVRRAFRDTVGNVDEDNYSAAIAYIDRQVGLLFAELRRQGLLDRTVIIVTSDHGEQFGGKGLYDHGNSLYATVTRVPLLVILPDGRRGGSRVAQPVSLRNLARTLLDLAGTAADPRLPGSSLARFWESPDPSIEPQDSPVLAELTPSPRAPASHRNARGELRSLVRGRWHLIANAVQPMELYDYWSDPRETTNVVAVPPGAAEVVRSMQQRMRLIDSLFPREMTLPNE